MSEQNAAAMEPKSAINPVANDLNVMYRAAQLFVKSGLMPKAINTPEKAFVLMQTGKELGLGYSQSIRAIHVIEGKPTLSADLMCGLVMARVPGSWFRIITSTNEQCVMEGGRSRADGAARFTWTIEDARRAGLLGKDNWKKYPRAMLLSRCKAEYARAVAPDAVMGLYTADELGADEPIEVETVVVETIAGDKVDKKTGEVVQDAPAWNRPPVEASEAGAEVIERPELTAELEQSIHEQRLKFLRHELEKIPDGAARDAAMKEAFASNDWEHVATYSIEDLQDAINRIEDIVTRALASQGGDLFPKKGGS